MNGVTKGVLGLVLWLVAGFAVTEFIALALSGWLQKPVPTGYAEPERTVAQAGAAD